MSVLLILQKNKKHIFDFGALKTEETPIIEGHRLFYNFIKPHESLNGMTPSEMAGITIEGDNKWLTLMKTSLSYKHYKKTTS